MIPRPKADLTTILGIAAIVGVFCYCAIIVIAHNPTAAALMSIASAGGSLIFVIQRAPLPSPQPTPVQTHGSDTVTTKEQTP